MSWPKHIPAAVAEEHMWVNIIVHHLFNNKSTFISTAKYKMICEMRIQSHRNVKNMTSCIVFSQPKKHAHAALTDEINSCIWATHRQRDIHYITLSCCGNDWYVFEFISHLVTINWLETAFIQWHKKLEGERAREREIELATYKVAHLWANVSC